MDDREHAIVTADPLLRVQQYRPMVRRYYECITSVYRHFWGDCYHFALFRDRESRTDALAATEHMIADEGRFRPGMDVLDVGCGLGGPALNIAAYSGVSITGVDLCEHHVRIASERALARKMQDRVSFRVGDGMHLPFADDSFDRIYVFEAGCHMPDKAAFCRECARVLRIGGEFLGLDWMQSNGLTQAEADRYIEPICQFCSVPDLISPAMMSNYLRRSGFEVLRSEEACSQQSLLRNFQAPEDAPPLLLGDWDATALQRVSRGGFALEEAARAGAFIVGRWHARKLA